MPGLPRRVRLILLPALLLLAALSAGAGVTAAQPGGLRAVDWRAVLERHALLEIQRDLPPPWDSFGPYVILRAGLLPDTGEVMGHARLTDVLYGDLDGDGVEEAVIPLDSGGTAGAIGLLLFRAGPAGPELVLAREGYKLGIAIEGGRLVLSVPVYVGFEGNCCPSGWERGVFALQGASLVTIAYSTGGYPQARVQTIQAFYQALNERRFTDAYDFLSEGFQAEHPFDTWVAGYGSTVRIEASAENGPADDEVTVQLTATDRVGGALVTSRFAGSWFLSWNGSRWLMERADIRPR